MNFPNRNNPAEKRDQKRSKCDVSIEWSYFNQEKKFDARLLNFSGGGVYFETDHDLKPGATIFLKTKIIPAGKTGSSDHERPRSVSLGVVKWRVDLSEKSKSHFGVGVAYPFLP